MKKTISAIILIGRNYDKNLLKKCLDSVVWCDEIVKVETESIKGSFSEWRNEGANRSKSDWLFYVDTDEEVTPELRLEIGKEMDGGNFVAYAIPRRNKFLGHVMHWGGWYPDFVLRLIRKDK